MTMGQLLLFKNDSNIKDEDQVEIMREVLYYLENPISGVSANHTMKKGWKETVDKITNRIPLKAKDECLIEAVESWYAEEKDIALLLSRKLGVLVKSSTKDKNSLKTDLKTLIEDQTLNGSLSVRNSVSDIKITLDFEVRSVAFSVKIIPPLNKGTVARITWIGKQMEALAKKNENLFNELKANLFVEANIKHAREHIRIPLDGFDLLLDQTKGKEIQAFNIVLNTKLGSSFSSNKKFITSIEKLIVDYYAGIVQHLTTWSQPAPKL